MKFFYIFSLISLLTFCTASEDMLDLEKRELAIKLRYYLSAEWLTYSQYIYCIIYFVGNMLKINIDESSEETGIRFKMSIAVVFAHCIRYIPRSAYIRIDKLIITWLFLMLVLNID